jgi:N6-L-threonylcarbamoyladenine synthase
MGPLVLGFETSCDETGVAIYEGDKGVLANCLYSQLELHKQFGGVVPEIASRSQLEKINPVTQEALNTANVSLNDIDAIAVTYKPGLPGSLLVGLCFAKAIAYAKNKKLIGVNHLEGHIFSSFLDNKVPFPHICLTASGGHTALYYVTDFGQYTLIGQTVDDAAGEAFDKIAKLIGVPHGAGGGPVIEQLAKKAGFADYFHYPRGTRKTTDFSFSGLKTAVMYNLVNRGAYDMEQKKFLAATDHVLQEQVASSLLVCVADIFEIKLSQALEIYPHAQAITFVGGVARNSYIRARLLDFARVHNKRLLVPSAQYCTDNGAMIAFVGYFKALKNEYSDLRLDIY